MKEIKFRQPIWENGKIVKWHYWGFKDGLYQLPTNSHESYLFIGRKDKNSNEIYEGDFLRDDKNIYLVKWSEKEAGFMIDRKGWMFDHFVTEISELEKLTVIGNILENPEL